MAAQADGVKPEKFKFVDHKKQWLFSNELPLEFK
jgi:hypothetical protein